uniref:Uncharacterized protein n=1 Tax=Candidozyma auris TaxID=498019 RepID=A0A0L0NWM4_CANAR
MWPLTDALDMATWGIRQIASPESAATLDIGRGIEGEGNT